MLLVIQETRQVFCVCVFFKKKTKALSSRIDFTCRSLMRKFPLSLFKRPVFVTIKTFTAAIFNHYCASTYIPL